MGGAYILRFGGSGGGVVSIPSLAIVDNGDGTGAVATIVDSDVTAVNMIQVLRLEHGFLDMQIEDVQSRIGDGEVTLDLSPGLYFGLIASTVNGRTATSSLVFFRVTLGNEPMHYSILQAAGSVIGALSLEGLPAGHLIVRAQPPASGVVVVPSIVVTTEGETEQELSGWNDKDQISYPVRVLFFLESGVTNEIDESRLYGWREAIRKAFRKQRLAGVSEVFTCSVENLQITDLLTLDIYSKLVGGIVLRFHVMESRGI